VEAQIQRLRDAFSAAIAPPREISVLDWAEENLILSKESSSQPGKFTAYPFQRELLEVLSASHPCQKVVAKMGAQLAKTLAIQAAIGYAIDIEQGPILLVEPRERDVEAFNSDRLEPMLRDTPALRHKVAEKKSRDSANTKLFKKFDGGSVTLVGSNSPANLAMRSIRWLFLDEVDRYETNKEGDVVSLAMRRQDTYPHSRKLFMCSTPHLEGASRIDQEYQLSDQREFIVPCPYCQYEQQLVWSGVVWGQRAGDDMEIPASDARYRCAGCQKLIPSYMKAEMLERGRWVAQNPDGEFPGFHLSQIYSPLKSWGQLASEWTTAQNDPEQMKVFINTVLAECWQQKGDAPEWEKLAARAENYTLSAVPAGVRFLTAGIDVQKDRLEMSVWGWGRGRRRWLVDYTVIPGELSDPSVKQVVTSAINVTYPTVSGVDLPILRAAIDSGFNAEEVYAWARSQGPGRVLVVKGDDRQQVLLGMPAPVETTTRGKRVKWGVKVWPVGVSHAKSELYGQLRMPRDEGQAPPPGWVSIPATGWIEPTREEFCRQMVSEQYVTRVVKGYKRGEWVKIRDRNEALDTANYARAAAEHVGISRLSEMDWSRMDEPFRVAEHLEQVAEQAQAEAQVEAAPVVAPAALPAVIPPRRPGPRVIGRLRF
jgi:phage terminase large subunit GpA-like protein